VGGVQLSASASADFSSSCERARNSLPSLVFFSFISISWRQPVLLQAQRAEPFLVVHHAQESMVPWPDFCCLCKLSVLNLSLLFITHRRAWCRGLISVVSCFGSFDCAVQCSLVLNSVVPLHDWFFKVKLV
jgi:hypothetical protein